MLRSDGEWRKVPAKVFSVYKRGFIGVLVFAVFAFLIATGGGGLFKRQPKIEIYEVYHKEAPLYQNDVVIPIHAGRALNTEAGRPLRALMIGDDTGDNISIKNDRYAELTALYWMWKNSKADYVGLMHYRCSFIVPHQKKTDCSKDDHLCELGLTSENLTAFLQDYDILVPSPWHGYETIYEGYKHHVFQDFQLAVSDVLRKYPDMRFAYSKARMSRLFYFGNMFIMKKEILDEYAAWLFGIFGRIDGLMSREEGKQKRAPGYLAERLFNIWFEYNRDKYRIGELNVEWR